MISVIYLMLCMGFSLCGMQKSIVTKAPQSFRQHEFEYNYCNGCCKRETIKKFQVCGNCKSVKYCSPDCQKQDWRNNHKLQCTKIDLEKRYEDIEKRRSQLEGMVATYLRSLTLTFTPEELRDKEMLNNLEEYGELYRRFLMENIYGCLDKLLNTDAKNEKQTEQNRTNYENALRHVF